MQQLTQSFTDHSSSDCRQQYFEILRSAWQLRPAMHAELRPPLLSMLGDADNTIRAQALTFWDSALPKHVGLRLQALLQNSLTDAGSLVCTVNGALLTPLLSPPQPPLLLLFLTLQQLFSPGSHPTQSGQLVHVFIWLSSCNMMMQKERLERQWTQGAAALLLELPKSQRIYATAIFDRSAACLQYASSIQHHCICCVDRGGARGMLLQSCSCCPSQV